MSEALRLGINRKALYAMRDAGVIEPVSRGLYRLASLDPLAHPDLVTVATCVPHGVLCLISALSPSSTVFGTGTKSGWTWCWRR